MQYIQLDHKTRLFTPARTIIAALLFSYPVFNTATYNTAVHAMALQNELLHNQLGVP